MSAQALLVVPPFLKYISGPLLGPEILAGAGRAAGHEVDVLDLNIRWIRSRIGYPLPDHPSSWVGDHDRPSRILRKLQRRFSGLLAQHLPATSDSDMLDEDPALTLTYSHAEVAGAARALADSECGAWTLRRLSQRSRPDLLGVSVLYSGQVLFALVISIVARRLWPGVRVVWGGPHMTALRRQIASDPEYGRMVGRFVFGYAEGTFVDLLDAIDGTHELPDAVVHAGSGTRPVARQAVAPAPAFSNLEWYGHGRLTLPAQLTRGCSYGRCTYCTYPAIEGPFRTLDLELASPTIALATDLGAAVSFKDSLVAPTRLLDLAELIGGQVPWSACTKLHRRLGPRLLRRLAAGGCRTLELGLETLRSDAQVLIDKRQSADLLLRTFDAAAQEGIALVVNYITGFPGAEAAEEHRWLTWLEHEISSRPALTARLERNSFQLERLSAMGRRPAKFGLRVTRAWPWSTVLAWRTASREGQSVEESAARAPRHDLGVHDLPAIARASRLGHHPVEIASPTNATRRVHNARGDGVSSDC